MQTRVSDPIRPDSDLRSSGSERSARVPRVALLIGNLIKEQPFLQGAAAAANQRGANLVCLIGKSLNWMDNSLYMGNVLYRMLDNASVDAAVTWAGTGVALGERASEAEMAAFFQALVPLPVVNYEKAIPGLHSVRTDTADGMAVVLRHLIAHHGRRKILLIRGPAQHFESEERVRAYRDVLAEFQIPYDPNLVFPPIGWTDRDHARLIRGYLDQRKLRPGIDFDGVAGTEYYFATHASDILREQGVDIPGQVSIAGFNDSPLALATTPTLTTMRKPFYRSGYRTVEIALDLAEGREVPQESFVPGELILRQSCGCISEAITAGLRPPAPVPETVPQLLAALEAEVGVTAAALPTGWSGRLWDAFESDLGKGTSNTFIRVLSELAFASPSAEELVDVWNRILNQMHAFTRARFAGPRLDAVETLLHQGRMAVAEAGLQAQTQLTVRNDHHREVLDIINQDMSAGLRFEALIEILAQELPRLEIPSCYLSTYTDPLHPEAGIRVLMAYRDYVRVPLPAGGRVIPSGQWVPEDLLPMGRTYTLVVQPLFYRERQMGLIVFELGGCEPTLFDILQRQISSDMDRILIEQEVREREAQFHAMAEEAPNSIFLVDREGRITYANPMLRQISKPGDPWLKAAHPEDAERMTRKWESAVSAGQPFNDVGRYLDSRDQTVWLDVRMAPIEVEAVTTGYVGIAVDISERLKNEDLLRESEERYRLMIESQAEGVGFIDPHGTFVFMNPAGEAMFGMPPGGLAGKKLIDFVPLEQADLVRAEMAKRDTRSRSSFELTISRMDAEVHHLMITTAPSLDESGLFNGSFSIFHDITERKRLEDHLYYLSMRDTMTGLFNRAFFDENLARLQLGEQFPVSVLVFDVDGLKAVNDHLGHAAGDELIRRMARLLKNSFRSDDLIARIGGDEFAVLLPGVTAAALRESIRRVRRNLQEENRLHSGAELRFSMGGATAKTGDSLTDTVQTADQAMYRDKARKRLGRLQN